MLAMMNESKLLTGVVLTALMVVALAATILLVLAWLFGIVAFGMEVGDRFTKAIHQSWEPVLSAGFGTFLLAIVLGTVNLVPCIGWLAGVLVGVIGLGAAVITMFGTRPLYQPVLNAPVVETGTNTSTPIPPAA